MKIYDINNNNLIEEIVPTSLSEIDNIYDLSEQAQIEWGKLDIKERVVFLEKFKDKILDNKEDIATLISKEMGKPIKEAIGEVVFAANNLDEKKELALKAFITECKEENSIVTESLFKPLGVSVVISPWNFPILMLHNMIIPSILAGNSVIIKPSEKTMLSARAYIKILKELLPDNLVEIVYGEGDLGSSLVSNERTKLVVFTGSEFVGKKIMEVASKNLTPVILELGGKDPLIVLEDADLEDAVDLAVINSFRNAGQVCVSTERVFVHSSLKEEFEKRVSKKVKAMTVGNSFDEVDLGPMSSMAQKELVLNQLNQSQGKFKYLIEPQILERTKLNPIVCTDVDLDAVIFTEETFGPVMPIRYFDNENKLIQEVNSSRYGLGGIIFSKNIEKARKLAEELDIGMIGINKRCNGVAGSSWVGAKQSGYSYHGDIDGYRNFTQKRIISYTKE